MNTAPTTSTASEQPLSELENEIIAFFVDLVRWFGAPKSLGAIYGLLFTSVEPISFEQIATRLQMSNGSVSQGLRILKDLGAAKVTFVAGERRDFFVAETQLRQLVSGFLRQRVERHLNNGEGRLAHVLDRASHDKNTLGPMPATLQERMTLLKRWQEQARGMLPIVFNLLDADGQEAITPTGFRSGKSNEVMGKVRCS